ncbi:MAG: cytochrome c biogenesis protein CcsA [Alcanivoracaceae bacterium]|nr:cytochrome c biogenesis protein CcsA [Alcanivoracaceae bacterium]
MSTAIWTGTTAVILYILATLVVVRFLRGNTGFNRPAVLTLGLLALLFHSCALWHLMISESGVRLGLFPVASLIGATGAAVVMLASLYRPLEWVSVMVFPYCAVTLPMAIWIHTGYAPKHLSHGLGAHVLLSITAYTFLALAACQAVLVMIQHQQLKDGHIRGVMRYFPAITLMETVLFELISAGTVLLTLAIAVGFIYVDDLFAQHLVHKTALTLVGWLVFVVLLWGRHYLGWRGVTAVRFTLTGFMFLILAFFGTQLVLEVILQRHA